METALLARLRYWRFSPAALFLAGEKGAWYDASDLTTLFQDSAGTTPVTAPGDPVGLMLDKSAGLAPGPELVTNGNNEAAVVTTATTRGSLSQSTDYVYSGAYSAKFTADGSTSGSHYLYAMGSLSGSKTYLIEALVYIPSAWSGAGLKIIDTNDGSWMTATVNTRDTWVKMSGIRVSKGSTWGVGIGQNFSENVAGQVCYIDNITVRELPGNHATQATSSKRPKYQSDGSYHWLTFDGVDDFMFVRGFDPSGSDELSLFVGARRNRDTPDGCIIEASTNSSVNGQSFALFCPPAGASHYYRSSGNMGQSNNAVMVNSAPATDIITCLSKQTANLNVLRVDGAQVGSNTVSQGSGGYASYDLYIGARGGSSIFFQGDLFTLTIRMALSSDTEVSLTEAYINRKMRPSWGKVSDYTFAGLPHQGVAVDGNGTLVTIDTNYIRRYSQSDLGTVLAANSDPVGELQLASGDSFVNHVGDGCIIGGELWLPVGNWPTGGVFHSFLCVYNLSTLALVRYYDVSAAARHVAGLCYNPEDGLIYVVDYDVGTSIFSFNTSGIYQGATSMTPALTNPQGIEYVDGYFIISADSPSRKYFSYSLAGTQLNYIYYRGGGNANNEGLSYSSPFLWIMDGAGYSEKLIVSSAL